MSPEKGNTVNSREMQPADELKTENEVLERYLKEVNVEKIQLIASYPLQLVIFSL